MLTIGMVFATKYEKGCLCVTLPDSEGNFIGIDSDGVECDYHISMVV